VVLLGRGERSKELEILVLRHELSILRRQVGKPRFTPADRLLLATLSRMLPRRSWRAFVVRPETLLRWHRQLLAHRWTYPHRLPGRPPIEREVREMILRLARENSSWGYFRIVGELRRLGIDVSATLVRNVLRAAGVPPAPQRGQQDWRSFLRQHGETTLACDFLTVDTVLLRRLYVLAFICIGSRRIEYVACTSNPDGRWILQQARNLLMNLDDRGQRPRFLLTTATPSSVAPSTPSSTTKGSRPSRRRSGHPTPTRTSSAGSAASGENASTVCSSSAAANSSTSSEPMCDITTSTGRTGHSTYRRPTPTRLLR
jgi:putative transposase